MISPVVCDGRVGLCRAVEFYKVALQNRLRLHWEIYKWEIYKNIETQRQPITELAASSNMLQWTVNLRQTLCCRHCLRLKKTQQEKRKLFLILQRKQNALLINSRENMQPQNKRATLWWLTPPCLPFSLSVWQVSERRCGLFPINNTGITCSQCASTSQKPLELSCCVALFPEAPLWILVCFVALNNIAYTILSLMHALIHTDHR